MPLNLKPRQMSVKDPQTGQYKDFDLLSSNVVSVNNKTGAVSLDAGDIPVDDSAQTPVTIGDVLSAFGTSLNEKYQKPAGGIPASDLAEGVIPEVPVQDVQVNGTSVLQNGVANVPVATDTNAGVVKLASAYGIWHKNSPEEDVLRIAAASMANIKAGSSSYLPVVPANMHGAAFYGLAKAAGADMASSFNPVGTYTDAAKKAICAMIGVQYEEPYRLIYDLTVSNAPDRILIDTDSNGLPFSLREIVIELDISAGETTGYGVIVPNTLTIPYSAIANMAHLAVNNFWVKTAKKTIVNLEVKGGRLFGSYVIDATSYYNFPYVSTSRNAFGIYECSSITSLLMYSAQLTPFANGTQIKVYGR